MTDHLEQAKEVLDDLEKGLKKDRLLWDELRELNPDFEQLSEEYWIEKYNRCWLHGATDVREANPLEHWLYDKPPLSDTAKSNATHCVNAWREWLSIKEAYYEDFQEFEFVEPKESEILIEFISRMARMVEEEGRGARLEWRAFKSFLGYLRRISSGGDRVY